MWMILGDGIVPHSLRQASSPLGGLSHAVWYSNTIVLLYIARRIKMAYVCVCIRHCVVFCNGLWQEVEDPELWITEHYDDEQIDFTAPCPQCLNDMFAKKNNATM